VSRVSVGVSQGLTITSSLYVPVLVAKSSVLTDSFGPLKLSIIFRSLSHSLASPHHTKTFTTDAGSPRARKLSVETNWGCVSLFPSNETTTRVERHDNNCSVEHGSPTLQLNRSH
jgi:hypothetical protein